MLASTGPFETMIDGEDQVIAYSVAMDLPGGVYPDLSLAVTKLKIDASIKSDMPDGTRLEEGFSTVEGTFTLAGKVDEDDETKTAGWLFGRYSPPALSDGTVSPLVRTDVLRRQVTITLGLYPEGVGDEPELLTKLVGLVEDYGLDSDGNVAFTVIDLRQSFRGSVDLPAVVTVPPFNAGMTNEFVADWLLRKATGGIISSWPAQRPQCVLAVGFRTSLWPEVGMLDTTSVGNIPGPTFAPGIFGTAFVGAIDDFGFTHLVPYVLADPVGTSLYVECFANSSGSPVLHIGESPATSTGAVVIDRSDPTIIGIEIISHAGTLVDSYVWHIGSDPGPFTAVTLSLPAPGGTAWSATLQAGALTQATGARTLSAPRSSDPWQAAWVIGIDVTTLDRSIEGWTITTEASPVPSYPFTPRAILDPSLNPLTVVSAVTGDPWQTIQQLAQSELAVAGFEGDTFFYRNRQTLRSSASVRDITSDQALNKIEESSSAAAIVNRAKVGWTPWTFADTATTLWTAPKAHKVPAHGSWSTTVTIDGLAAQVDTVLTALPESSTDVTHSYLRASVDKAGTSTHPGISATVAQSAGNTFTITATNPTGTPAWLVSSADHLDMPPGTPVVRIAGLAVTAGDEQTQDYQWPPPTVVGLNGLTGAAGSRFGEIVYQQSGNGWNQDEDATDQLCHDIVTGSYVSRADLVNTDIDPDPRLERCDRTRMIDTARTGVNAYALLFGYSITYEAGDPPTFSMTIDARTITAPGGWIGGADGTLVGAVETWGY